MIKRKESEKKQSRIEKQKLRFAEMSCREKELRGQGYQMIAGVDEVGRGPLAGPVVAAAVVLPEDFDVLGIDDSKKLSEKKREALYGIICEKAVAYGIGMADEKTIDEINILQATKLAMKRALEDLEARLREKSAEQKGTMGAAESPGLAETTGSAASTESAADEGFGTIDYILFDAMEISDIDIPQESIIKGDANVLAIAAASIIAKVTRDRMMVGYAAEYPGYAFESNKGYGTKAHYEGIRAQGMCPIHRRTFLKNL